MENYKTKYPINGLFSEQILFFIISLNTAPHLDNYHRKDVSTNSFSGKKKKIFEPFSPSNERRIKALKILKENGIETYAFVSPIIPGLINLKDVIRKTKAFTDSYWFEFINIRGAGKEFMETLRRNFPKSYEILTNKKKFLEFIKESKKAISSENIKIQGIVIH